MAAKSHLPHAFTGLVIRVLKVFSRFSQAEDAFHHCISLLRLSDCYATLYSTHRITQYAFFSNKASAERSTARPISTAIVPGYHLNSKKWSRQRLFKLIRHQTISQGRICERDPPGRKDVVEPVHPIGGEGGVIIKPEKRLACMPEPEETSVAAEERERTSPQFMSREEELRLERELDEAFDRMGHAWFSEAQYDALISQGAMPWGDGTEKVLQLSAIVHRLNDGGSGSGSVMTMLFMTELCTSEHPIFIHESRIKPLVYSFSSHGTLMYSNSGVVHWSSAKYSKASHRLDL
ncbi:hypothetical protein EVG20_g8759 [Dentipellis fragilis]|uniref:Uncharacterized protein n=1 Tax=Dentipellis fragilis TaxID=205917 RepID=A0A4Y9Y4Z7_9AGAM|nr:hypothetical protein EVG20_g8759 [Dentipellis fragilis]